MGLVLDEPKDEDIIFTSDKVTMLADSRMKDEIEKGGGVKIEFVNDPWRGSGIAIAFAQASSDCSSSGCSC